MSASDALLEIGASATATERRRYKKRWRRFVNHRSLFQQFKAMETSEEIVTYWLCPGEPEHDHFARLIGDLAARFDAPTFEPHVTIHTTTAERENPARVLAKIVDGRRPYRLSVRGLDYSDEYTKTLFVQLSPDTDLAQLSEDLRRASVSPSDYQLNPHVSLLYKKWTKKRYAASLLRLSCPLPRSIFSSLKRSSVQRRYNRARMSRRGV